MTELGPIPLPPQLTYGAIKWNVVGLDVDDQDADSLPDVVNINGTAIVTAEVPGSAILAQELPIPLTILTRGVELLIKNGRLQDRDNHTLVKFLACDSPGLSHLDWSYRVDYQLDDGYTFGSFSFKLHTDEELDLTLAIPLDSSEPGVVITKGAQGDKGDAATITIGEVVTVSPATPAAVRNVGTSTDAIFELDIPQGRPGLGSVVSINGELPAENGNVQLDAADVGAATPAYVNAIGTNLNTPDTIMRRDASGWAQIGALSLTDAPASADRATRKDYVDTRDALLIPLTQKGAASGVATLDASSKIPVAQLPDLAISAFLGSAASQAAMLAFVGQRGDWAVRTDLGSTWIVVAEPSSAIASWREISYPAAPVTSVAGKQGVVTLAKSDVGLGNVDNTSDVNKPVSTAQQTAINGRIAATEKAVASGVATLNGQAILPTSQRPLSPMNEAARLLAYGFGNTEMSMRGYTVGGDQLQALTALPGVGAYSHPSTSPVYGTRDVTIMQYQGRYWMAATRPLKSDYLGTATHIQIAVSDDLVTWKWQYDLPADVTNAYRTWAPEWFVDDDGSVYLYYSVSVQAVAIGSVTQFDIYARKATGWQIDAASKWGVPSMMSGISAATTAGAPTKVIDAQVTRIGTRYCMFVKDEVNAQIMRAWANSPTGPWTLDRTGNWLGLASAAEGPQLVRMPNGKWRLYYDRYTAVVGGATTGQLAFRESTDLDTWGAEVALTYPLVDLRHLGLIWLSAGEWRAFQSRPRRTTVWRTGAQSMPTAPAVTPIIFTGATGDYDMWSSGTPTRLIAPEPGVYTLHVEASWFSNATGQRSMAYRKSNGAWVYFGSQNANGGGFGVEQNVTAGGITMIAGDYIEVGGFQNSGVAIDLTSAAATLVLGQRL